MRIGISALFLIPGKVGGSEVYLRNLLCNLARIDKKNEYIVFTNKENFGTFQISQPNLTEVFCPIGASFRPARILWEQLVLPFQIKKYKIDVLHSPGYTAPLLASCCSIVTIHDMNYFYYPEDFSKLTTLFLKILVPLGARTSDKVIAVSKNSKKDIVKILKIPESKICVIYEAGSSNLSGSLIAKDKTREKLKKKYGIERKFILSVSASHPHKNLYRLIEAYDILCKKHHPDCQLVIVGIRGRAHFSLVNLAKEVSLEDSIIFTGWIPKEDLSLLYSEAELFVFPSLFEGFGIPVLEAMVHGTPVVSANTASLPEVAGEAAILINPYNIGEIAEAVYKVLTNETLRDSLIKKGLEQAKHFSWEKTARETLAVYKRTWEQK